MCDNFIALSIYFAIVSAEKIDFEIDFFGEQED